MPIHASPTSHRRCSAALAPPAAATIAAFADTTAFTDIKAFTAFTAFPLGATRPGNAFGACCMRDGPSGT